MEHELYANCLPIGDGQDHSKPNLPSGMPQIEKDEYHNDGQSDIGMRKCV